MLVIMYPLSCNLQLCFSLHDSEPFIIFSGGLSYDKAGRRHTLTIMHGKAITVLEMDYPIVDFMALCETPYNNGEDTRAHAQRKTHIILFLNYMVGFAEYESVVNTSLYMWDCV